MRIPVPYTFNIIKHYLTGARELCRKAAKSKEQEHQFLEEMNKTGSNLLDVYTGNLELQDITKDISGQLKKLNAYSREGLNKHLKNKEYIVLKIIDESHWIVRIGNDENRYIHIHPGRTGKHVKRFHSNAWKTALFMFYLKMAYNHEINTLEDINQIRVSHLQLSPMKRLKSNSRIMKAYETICQRRIIHPLN